MQTNLWQSFSDLLETHHALEGIADYYVELRGTDEDQARIRNYHIVIQQTQKSGDLDAEDGTVMQYQIAVTEATHNVVLLHLLRCMVWGRCWNSMCVKNFELLYLRNEMLATVRSHRDGIFEAIVAREPEKARGASHRHLAFIEEVLLNLSRKHTRHERSLWRLQHRKDSELFSSGKVKRRVSSRYLSEFTAIK